LLDQNVLRIGLHIGDMDDLAVSHRSAHDRPSPGHDRMVAQILLEFTRISIARDAWVDIVLRPVDGCAVGLAQSRRRLDQRIEHGLQIEGRAADDLEHVGGGGLLLQRLAQLVEKTRVLYGDNRLGGEVCY
jgi:hypothetical protein